MFNCPDAMRENLAVFNFLDILEFTLKYP